MLRASLGLGSDANHTGKTPPAKKRVGKAKGHFLAPRGSRLSPAQRANKNTALASARPWKRGKRRRRRRALRTPWARPWKGGGGDVGFCHYACKTDKHAAEWPAKLRARLRRRSPEFPRPLSWPKRSLSQQLPPETIAQQELATQAVQNKVLSYRKALARPRRGRFPA